MLRGQLLQFPKVSIPDLSRLVGPRIVGQGPVAVARQRVDLFRRCQYHCIPWLCLLGQVSHQRFIIGQIHLLRWSKSLLVEVQPLAVWQGIGLRQVVGPVKAIVRRAKQSHDRRFCVGAAHIVGRRIDQDHKLVLKEAWVGRLSPAKGRQLRHVDLRMRGVGHIDELLAVHLRAVDQHAKLGALVFFVILHVLQYVVDDPVAAVSLPAGRQLDRQALGQQGNPLLDTRQGVVGQGAELEQRAGNQQPDQHQPHRAPPQPSQPKGNGNPQRW